MGGGKLARDVVSGSKASVFFPTGRTFYVRREIVTGSSGSDQRIVVVEGTGDYFDGISHGVSLLRWYGGTEFDTKCRGEELCLMLCPCRDKLLDVSLLRYCGFNGSVFQWYGV